MKIAAMQPYFLPYLGYFSLIASVDIFIIFDTPKFLKKSWMTRNRILHPDQNEEFKYINLPTHQNSSNLACCEITVLKQDQEEFTSKHFQIYKKMRAKNYDKICGGAFPIMPTESGSFSKFIRDQLVSICSLMNIKTKIIILSETDYVHDDTLEPGLHALNISKYFKAKTYVNAPGGKGLFDKKIYTENGIELTFINPGTVTYQQGKREGFIPNLSVVDVLMFNDFPKIQREVLNYELV